MLRRNFCHFFRLEYKTSVIITILTWCCTSNAVWGPKTFFCTAHHPGGALCLQREQPATSYFAGTTNSLCTKGECLLSGTFIVRLSLSVITSLANVLVITYSVQIYSFVWLCIIVMFWQAWIGINDGKAVLSGGGCRQFLREQVSWTIVLHVNLFSTPSTRSLCTTGVCHVRYLLLSLLIISKISRDCKTCGTSYSLGHYLSWGMQGVWCDALFGWLVVIILWYNWTKKVTQSDGMDKVLRKKNWHKFNKFLKQSESVRFSGANMQVIQNRTWSK
jgi:hypothetical protein